MPVKHLVNRGIGFSPGSVKYIMTLGLSIGVPPPVYSRYRRRAETEQDRQYRRRVGEYR